MHEYEMSCKEVELIEVPKPEPKQVGVVYKGLMNKAMWDAEWEAEHTGLATPPPRMTPIMARFLLNSCSARRNTSPAFCRNRRRSNNWLVLRARADGAEPRPPRVLHPWVFYALTQSCHEAFCGD